MYQNINSLELIDVMKDEDINLIDIRDSYIYSSGTIKNAKNIPLNYLITNPENFINKDDTYYIFCDYGSRSPSICDYLTRKGFHVINIVDGYYGYKDSIN